MQLRKNTLCTSVFTVGEVLTGPYPAGKTDIVSQVRDSFHAAEIVMIPFDADTAEYYARVRSAYKVALADAIHLASAAQAGVDLFLTNDDRLKKLKAPGIQFIAGLDVSLF
jgi:predicted nucleic acid-binding protein